MRYEVITVAVAAPLPATLPVRGVEAHEHSLVEAVEEALVLDDLRELGLQSPRLPLDAGVEAPVGATRDPHQPAPDSVAHGREEAIPAEHHRLRDSYNFV